MHACEVVYNLCACSLARRVWEGPGLILTSAIMLNNQPDQSAASNYTAVPITDADSGKQICSGEWWGGKKKDFFPSALEMKFVIWY